MQKSEDTDQTGWISRSESSKGPNVSSCRKVKTLIRLAGFLDLSLGLAHNSFYLFCHFVAHLLLHFKTLLYTVDLVSVDSIQIIVMIDK